MSRAAGFFLGLMLVVGGALLLWKLQSRSSDQAGDGEVVADPDWRPRISPADYKTGDGEPWIRDFELVDQQGEAFRSDELKGKVWVASFFFSSCPSTCVQQNREVQSLHEVWARKGVKFVSITCDAENDTPVRLHEYSQKFTTDHENWKFLSGDGDYINRIGSDFFRVAVGPRTHTDSFVLVDKWGNARGTYNWQDKAEMKDLNQQLVLLLKEQQEPEEVAEKRKQLDEQIAQFIQQQEKNEEEVDESSDTSDGSGSLEPSDSTGDTEE